MNLRIGLAGAVFAAWCGSGVAVAAEFPKIYNTQEETIALLKPAEAVKRMRLPEGFEATVFAAEPEVNQPIGLCFDSRGRLWVAENYTYAEGAINFDRNLRDRIVILEDSDHDGRFDKRTVFWDQAQKLTSVAVGFGGVYATCPPELLFLPDRDGDDVPDGAPEVLLNGFDDDRVRHTLANGLKWGPDGWLYGRHGIQATSLVGKPGTAREERNRVNGCIWRYHPTRRTFEVYAQGTTNPWGSDWDENGELFFINTVIGHLWHAVPGAYFKRMYGEPFNPHVYELIDQVADHVHWDTREAWSDINKGMSASTMEAGGGHAHTGLLIYQGDNWPAEYRGELFTLNFHGKRMNHDRLKRAGADYTATHAPDFMKIDDPWFRGMDLLTGPEGAVYVSDWSDIGECHDQNGIHRTSGRIYRISYGKPAGFSGDLSKLANEELVRLLSHRNEWFVREARLVLQERKARGEDVSDAVQRLRVLYEGASDTRTKLRALWALYGMEAVSEAMLEKQLGAADEHLRVWAIRLLTDDGAPSERIAKRFAAMAETESSGLVLNYLAAALQRMAVGDRWALAGELAAHGEFDQDRVLPLMVWYGIEASVGQEPAKSAELIANAKMGTVRKLATRRVFENLRENREAAGEIVALLGTAGRANEVLRGMAEGIRGMRQPEAPKEWASAVAVLLKNPDPEVKGRALELDARFGSVDSQRVLLQQLTDGSTAAESRRRALNTLAESGAPGLRTALQEVLSEPKLAGDAIRALAAAGDAETATVLLTKFGGLEASARREALNALAGRPGYALELLRAVQRGKVKRQDLNASVIRQLRSFQNPEIDEKLSEVLPQSGGSSSKAQLFKKFEALLRPERIKNADLSRGREVFQQACAVCHKLYGDGAQIGPELTGADRQNLEYLLENILNPSGIVPEAYRSSVIAMRDDRVLNGIITSRTEQTISVQTVSEKLTLPKDQIETVRESELSMMPDGLLDALNEEQIVNLMGYLMSTTPPGNRN